MFRSVHQTLVGEECEPSGRLRRRLHFDVKETFNTRVRPGDENKKMTYVAFSATNLLSSN